MTFKIITKNKLQQQLLTKTAKTRKHHADKAAVVSAASNPNQNDLAPNITIVWRKVSELTVAGRKIRKVTDRHIAQAVHSIQHFGFISPMIVRGPEMIDGHIRLRAAEVLEMGFVPCIDVSHLSAAKTRMLRISLNRLAETGEWDADELKLELTELKLEGYDLKWSGFTPQELDIILRDAETGPEWDTASSPPEVPVAKLGDLWLMDNHRLICGNSLLGTSYLALMNGKIATAVLTDPPFNVKIKNNVSGLGKKTHGEFQMASGEMTEAKFASFLDNVHALMTANLVAGGVAYVFIDWRSADLVMSAGKKAGMQHINTAVWYKGNGGMGGFLRSAHEFCVIFCKGERPKINNIQLGRHGRDRTNVWEFPGANQAGSSAGKALKDHPTPKNVDMCIEALLDVTHQGDIVLDPFLGSGSSLISAERSGRVCYGLELEPKFVDVCIRRWQDLTGKQAVHAKTGLTYAETLAEMAEEDDVEAE